MGNYRIIVSLDSKDGIGSKGGLVIWDREDLRRFRAETWGNVVIMGRKTWESIKNKPLDGRVNVVISRTMSEGSGYILFRSVEECVSEIKSGYVIGGGEIYREFLDRDLVDTIVASEFPVCRGEADVWFPCFRDKFSVVSEECVGSKFYVRRYSRMR
jgi:dihydrofolate reductase